MGHQYTLMLILLLRRPNYYTSESTEKLLNLKQNKGYKFVKSLLLIYLSNFTTT